MSHCEHASLPRRFSLARGAAVGLLVVSACGARPRHPGEVRGSPQAALEAQLINRQHPHNRRTRDGGMVYAADFTAATSEPLRVPYDLLKLECENHGGRFEPIAAAKTSAAGLARDDVPDAIHARLREADERGLFGTHRCEAGSNVWQAELDPAAIEPTGNGNIFRFSLYVKTTTDEDYAPGSPNGPGLPAIGPLPPSASELPPPPPAADGIAPPPPPPAERRATGVSPLDAQPPRPAVAGDQLLADPRPFGLEVGSDAPEVVAQKLKLDLTRAAQCDSAQEIGLTGLCWDRPGSEALRLRASFADLGHGRVLAELSVWYPTSAYTWLARTLNAQLGAPDAQNAAELSRTWSWLHTSVELSRDAQESRVYVGHKPSVDRAALPRGTAGREQAKPTRIASPWQLQLGYETAQGAQTKLQAAGFSVPDSGCSDGSPDARPVFTRTCPLKSSTMPHVHGAWVRTVDIGDGRPRLAELGYQLDKAGWGETLRDLKSQYGEPIASNGGALQWWTGPVGITMSPGAKGEGTLRYYHGRLLQYFIVAEAKRRPEQSAAATPSAARGL